MEGQGGGESQGVADKKTNKKHDNCTIKWLKNGCDLQAQNHYRTHL
jgi:hypothetical protein